MPSGKALKSGTRRLQRNTLKLCEKAVSIETCKTMNARGIGHSSKKFLCCAGLKDCAPQCSKAVGLEKSAAEDYHDCSARSHATPACASTRTTVMSADD